MSAQPQTSRPTGIEVSDTLIASDTPGIDLFLRNKRPAGREAIGSLLLVHGATFPSISLFDVDVDGLSFLDALAQGGIDTWAFDVRGYGGSTRLPEMSRAPASGPPLVRATEAAGDVASALAHIRATRSPARLGLLGMSWGGSIAGIHAARDRDLDALVLVAPLWLSATPLRFDGGAPILTHRDLEASSYKAAWFGSAPEDRQGDLLPAGWFDRWAEVTAATDPNAPAGRLRAPSGCVADVREHWTAGKPLYEPAAITAPTLVTRGTWDIDVRRDMALDLFDRLTGARDRAYLEVAEATHMLLMEPARRTGFAEILSFVTSAFASRAS